MSGSHRSHLREKRCAIDSPFVFMCCSSPARRTKCGSFTQSQQSKPSSSHRQREGSGERGRERGREVERERTQNKGMHEDSCFCPTFILSHAHTRTHTRTHTLPVSLFLFVFTNRVKVEGNCLCCLFLNLAAFNQHVNALIHTNTRAHVFT